MRITKNQVSTNMSANVCVNATRALLQYIQAADSTELELHLWVEDVTLTSSDFSVHAAPQWVVSLVIIMVYFLYPLGKLRAPPQKGGSKAEAPTTGSFSKQVHVLPGGHKSQPIESQEQVVNDGTLHEPFALQHCVSLLQSVSIAKLCGYCY